ncbi:PAS domain-containing protein [Haloarchaeobius sp. DT45]|uniref:PAS domain-containing protein n=1 Tax=Haloarchaeobius sp. DT45 TaxID=3446116 RepID=UPI003F6B88E6
MRGGETRRDDIVRSDALERVSDGVVAFDADLRYTYVNEQAASLLERDSDELIGEYVWDVFPDEEGSVADDRITEALETQQQRSYERYSTTAERWFEARIYPDEDGLLIYFTDISDRKSYEQELERVNQQLTALVENTSEAVYIKDDEGQYQRMNEAAAAFFDLTPEEVLGKRDEELFDPASARTVREVDERIMRSNESDSFEAVQYIDGERHVFLDNKFPYHDEDGEVAGVMGISRDITDRKRREQELKTVKEEYETVFENAQDSLFLVDVDTEESDDTADPDRSTASHDVTFRFERLNPRHQHVSGMSTDELRGQTPREAFGEDVGATIEANYRRCFETRAPITYEEELPMPAGNIVWQTKLAPLVVDGEVTRIIGTARDVTERVERERELERQNERLDEFAGVITHDLRNPLSIAWLHLEFLREEYEDDHLDAVADSLDRMQAIIDDTLTLARQGKTVGETTPVPITSLVGQCWRMVETDGAKLDLRDEFSLCGDRDRVQNVFENLFRNSVEHGAPRASGEAGDSVEHGSTSNRTQSGDSVEQSSTGNRTQSGDSVKHGDDGVTIGIGRLGDCGFYVEDDGPGIPVDQREAVFEPGHSTAENGTGFGLAIVNRVADAHGWDLTVTTGSEGGARFEFTGVDMGPDLEC